MLNAIIFDMDGVISDTQKLHAQVESEILARFGIKLSPDEITKQYAGVKTNEFFVELLEKQSTPFNIDELMNEKMTKMAEIVSKSVDEIPGATKLIKGVYADGYKLAIVSSSDKNYVNIVINKLSLADFFEIVIAGDMVKKGKPDPECFLMAARLMEVEPEKCLVIEDGVSGMQAARDAGMECIGLVSDVRKEYPTENLVSSLSEISMGYLESF